MCREPVVVSGIGVVNSGFIGIVEAEKAFATPHPNPVEVGFSEAWRDRSGSRRAMLVDSSRIRRLLNPMMARRMSPASRFAVCAALMAIENAGLEIEAFEGPTAVILATAYGAPSVTEKILRQIMLENPEVVSPALFTESVANAPAAQIALAVKARGANITITERQAGPAIAIRQGLRELRSGRAERVLVGAVDEINPMLHAILDRFGVLAQPDESGFERALPFDRHRTGWIAAEGATVLVLENAHKVFQRREPHTWTVIASSGSTFDSTAPRSGWSRNPGKLARETERFLLRSGAPVESITRIVVSACGHRECDRLEAGVLRALWKETDCPPPVLVPAATAGYHGGAMLTGAVLAASGRVFGVTPGFSEIDPELGIVPHDGRSLGPGGRTLVLLTSPGGSSGWVLLDPV